MVERCAEWLARRGVNAAVNASIGFVSRVTRGRLPLDCDMRGEYHPNWPATDAEQAPEPNVNEMVSYVH